MYDTTNTYTSSLDNLNSKSQTTQNFQNSKISSSLKIKYSNSVKVDYRYDFPKRFIYLSF
jgi:hypothetical protein